MRVSNTQLPNGSEEYVGPSFTDRLIARNPCYLISVAFVIHGTGFWFKASGGDEPWKLMAMLSVFILMLAMTGVAIVRIGNVWDDARSIFLLLMLLVVELAVSFDQTFVGNIQQGIPLLIFGWGLSALIFEGILRGLRFNFPILMRLPAHAMIVLLFLYPILMAQSIQHSEHTAIHWLLLLYPFAAGLVILTLVPAVRRGREFPTVAESPWKWPYFPWIFFVGLSLGICLRSYAMCVSLDPAISEPVMVARELGSIFELWFLTPMIVAAAMLLVEAGRIHNHKSLLNTGLALPLMTVVLSSAPGTSTTLQENFRLVVVQHFASPAFMTLIFAFLFYLIAFFRRIKSSEWWLSSAVLGFAYINADSLGVTNVVSPRLLPLTVLSVAHILLFTQRSQRRYLTFAILCGIPVGHEFLAHLGGIRMCFVIEVHLLAALSLFVGILQDNKFTCGVAALLLLIFCMIAALPLTLAPVKIALLTRVAYIACVSFLSVSLIYWTKRWYFALSALFGIATLLIIGGRFLLDQISSVRGWQGLVFYAAGVFWFVVAVVVSYFKSSNRHAELAAVATREAR